METEVELENLVAKRGRPKGFGLKVSKMKEKVAELRSGPNPMTYQEIAKQLGVTKQYAHQLHGQTIRKTKRIRDPELRKRIIELRESTDPPPSWTLVAEQLGISGAVARQVYHGIHYSNYKRKTIPIDQPAPVQPEPIQPESVQPEPVEVDFPEFRGKEHQPEENPDLDDLDLKNPMVEMRLQGDSYKKIDKTLGLEFGTAQEACQQNKFLRNTPLNILKRNVVRNQLIKLIQNPILIQQGNGVRGLQVSIQMPLIGDSAIAELMKEEEKEEKDGDIKSAIRHVLSLLPEPRLRNFKYFAAFVAEGDYQDSEKAAEYLGTSIRSFHRIKRQCREVLGSLADEMVEENTEGGGGH